MRIGVDLDGVLTDFNRPFIDLVIKTTGRDLFPPRPFDIPTWNYPEHYGYTGAEVSTVWDIITDSTRFWRNLPPLPGASEFLFELNRWVEEGDHALYFLTSRLGRCPKAESESWLRTHRIENPTVLIVNPAIAKAPICASLSLDFFLDDKTETCEAIRDHAKTYCHMLAQPWNKVVWGVPRLQSLSEFLAIIEEARHAHV